jgi:hypothetical protein
MFSPVLHVLSKYYTLLMKMALDVTMITFTKSNLCLLTNVEMLLGLNFCYAIARGNPLFDQICTTTRCVYV